MRLRGVRAAARPAVALLDEDEGPGDEGQDPSAAHAGPSRGKAALSALSLSTRGQEEDDEEEEDVLGP